MIKASPVYFKDNFEKAAYMQRGAEKDAHAPLVRAWARQFLQGPDARSIAEAIFSFCQLAVDYVNDPGVEILDSASVALARGFGDCDAKSRLFVALCLACGIPARIQPRFREGGKRFPHVLAAVQLNHQWYEADPTIVNSRIGQIPIRNIVTNYWGSK